MMVKRYKYQQLFRGTIVFPQTEYTEPFESILSHVSDFTAKLE